MSYAYRHHGWEGISSGERIRSAVSDIRFMLDRRGVHDQLAPVLGPNNVTALDEMLTFIVESTVRDSDMKCSIHDERDPAGVCSCSDIVKAFEALRLREA